MDFKNIDDIRNNGFEGFVTVRNLQANGCREIPDKAGVYLVLRSSSSPPEFLPQSIAGHHKGKDSTEIVNRLEKKWIEGAPVLNIGKAGAPGKAATLQTRLGAYMRFGQGRNAGHRGGRYIWQLADAGDLFVCWKTTPGFVPRSIEKTLIEEFKHQHNGRRPFANLQD
jgi:hypothetical protein